MTVRPVAQPPCRPPSGTTRGTFHWLRRPANGGVTVALWEAPYWSFLGISSGTFALDLAFAGWRYVGPCVPSPDRADE